MPRLYAGADAYVLPTRGEGWGRPFMEAMAMGLPTIASRTGAATSSSCTPRRPGSSTASSSTSPEDADLFNNLYHGHKWFEADPDELAGAMREIAGDPDAARAKAAPARAELIAPLRPRARSRTASSELADDA